MPGRTRHGNGCPSLTEWLATRIDRESPPPAFSRQIRLDAPEVFDGFSGRGEVPVPGARDPPLAVVLQGHLELVLALELRKLVFDVLVHQTIDVSTFHVRNGADGELSGHFGRNDSLGPGGGKGAFDAVDRERRVSPSTSSD